MKSYATRLAEMQADPDDKRHGTTYGYSIGCRCDRCKAAWQEYSRDYYKRRTAKKWAEQEMKKTRRPKLEPYRNPVLAEKREKVKRPAPKDICTLNDEMLAMMKGHSVTADHCVICGRSEPLNQHHIVPRSAGELIQGGVKMRKPTITLCGIGNNLHDANGRTFCHGLVHHRRLHFRWRRGSEYYTIDSVDSASVRPNGRWEYLITDEPTKYSAALQMDGWQPLPSKN